MINVCYFEIKCKLGGINYILPIWIVISLSDQALILDLGNISELSVTTQNPLEQVTSE